MIKLIWAQTKTGVIGKKNQLPWTIPEEMHHFKQTTLHQTVLMGRKTFVSLNSKPLPRRLNYVLTSQPLKFQDHEQKNLHFVSNVDEIIQKYHKNPTEDLYVIGGNQVFGIFWEYADEVIRTIIHRNYSGDTYIQDFNWLKMVLTIRIVEKKFTVEYWTNNEGVAQK